jgi:glutathione S-transferase
MSVVLYNESFWISPYVFTCFVALREKKVDFELRNIALEKRAQKEPDYLKKSLTGRVPALEHDGFTVAESSAIVEYVDETFPGPKVLPQNSKDRARARQVMSWIRTDVTLGLRDERPTSSMFYESMRKKTPFTAAGRASADAVLAVAERLVGDGRPHIADTWSIADADLAFILHRLILNGDDVPAKVRAYAEAQWKRPAVVEFVGQKRAPYTDY